MKKICVVMVLAALGVVLAVGCSKKSGGSGEDPNSLVVWSFTDELGNMLDKYYKPTHPDVKIEYSLTTTEQFPNKLDPVLASGRGAPDVFALEDAFVRKYVESGLLLDLTDEYNKVKDKLIAYPVQIGSYNGRVYALSWQAAPGAVFYRRSLAKKYLGTDDPQTVQAYLENTESFLETAELLKQKSGGKCVMISAIQELFFPYKASRKSPWVVDGTLTIDPQIMTYLDMVKLFHDKGYEGRAQQWQETWFAGMKGVLKNERGDDIEVFSYFLPTWGLHYVLKTNTPDTAGDWAMVAGPLPYRWGGTWIGAYKGTKKPDAAKELILYLTTDDAFLTQYALDSGDLVGNLAVIESIKDTFEEPFLGGQNHYAAFAEMAKSVDGSLVQGTDQAIESIFTEMANAYVNGEKTRDQVVEDFKSQVAAQLGF